MAARCFLPTSRRGVAPLELVLALPLLVSLLALLFTIADAAIKANTSVIAARADAWSRRDRPESKDALLFQSAATSRSLIHGSVEVPTRSFLAEIGASTAKAEHAVMGGSWDHGAIDLNRQPSYQLYDRVGADSAAALETQSTGGIPAIVAALPNYQDTIAEATAWVAPLKGSIGPKLKEAQRQLDELRGQIPQINSAIERWEKEVEQLRRSANKKSGDVLGKVFGSKNGATKALDKAEETLETLKRTREELEKAVDLLEKGIEKAKRGQTLIDQMQGV